MIRHADLFSQIVDTDNILRAHRNARKGKSHYREVKMVNQDPEKYAQIIQDSLLSKTFTTSPYQIKTIHEPKTRDIYKLPYFPDRIIHHAVMQIIQPIWDNVFIHDLYSAIPGKGLHAGSYRLRKFMEDNEGTRYCLKFDISKFYPSMDHEYLIDAIQRKIKCKDTLWLLEDIIHSTSGVPIGNYLSQYFGNIYLNRFDHWIKEDKQMKYYLRYCDDGVILHTDKSVLKTLLDEIKEFLEPTKLKLNPKTSIFPVDKCGIDFLGYRHFRDYILLRKSSARRFKKRIGKIRSRSEHKRPESVISSVMSSIGWLKHCNSRNLLSKTVLDDEIIMNMVDVKSFEMGISNPLRRLVIS